MTGLLLTWSYGSWVSNLFCTISLV